MWLDQGNVDKYIGIKNFSNLKSLNVQLNEKEPLLCNYFVWPVVWTVNQSIFSNSCFLNAGLH